ncbi:probable receptor-like protein kinase At5g61350 [Macadamia integrifolia]|uniref:probable receptor-like protein kinase At5g61350 n=1 Tax=Macadamia integrifolia TaxID=60698 RepID=UPI001C4EF234|nr:probable receptor-like protein kinase At5g61350 [Macadamia integrifolia]
MVNHVFVADNSQFLKTHHDIMATTSNSIASPLYQTARIFNGPTSSYNFPILQQGRHWIRLYFFPFQYQGYNMSMAIFSVTAQNFIILSNFQTQNGSVFKEFSLPVVSDNLVHSFIPAEHSFAFLSGLEVVSVPDSLNTDDAQNCGPTRDIAPDFVYGTATKMNYANATVEPNFNITWKFKVDSGFQHLIRFHFCDIVSRAHNMLYFNVHVNSWVVAPDLDLSSLTANRLAAPYYMDFVLGSSNITILSVSVGPSTSVSSRNQKAFLNGLEIMKIISPHGSKKTRRRRRRFRLIVGLVLGVLGVLVMVLGYHPLLHTVQKTTTSI